MLLLMIVNFLLYKYIQPIIYLIIIGIILIAMKEKENPFAILEKVIFYSSIPPFITLTSLIFTGNGDLFLELFSMIPEVFKETELLKSILTFSSYISWLLCASVVPLRILFNKLKIDLKIGLILYSINFIIYFPVMIAMISGYLTFP